MVLKSNPKIVIIGNPNSGKSTLFNKLTGKHQKTANCPGVTVDKHKGYCSVNERTFAEIIDLPGTTNLYPQSVDEQLVFNTLCDPGNDAYPDVAIVIADATHLKRDLLLFTQVKDLGIPVILAINMMDVAEKRKQVPDIKILKKELGVQVVSINAKSGKGLDNLKHAIDNPIVRPNPPVYDLSSHAPKFAEEIQHRYNLENPYKAFQQIQKFFLNHSINKEDQEYISSLQINHKFDNQALQNEENESRTKYIEELINKAVRETPTAQPLDPTKMDRILTHNVLGNSIFMGVLFIFFQLIYLLAIGPQMLIAKKTNQLIGSLEGILPDYWLSALLCESLIPAIGGILQFLPVLFCFYFLIAIIEESGLMSRIIWQMDKIFSKIGISGKAAIPLITYETGSMIKGLNENLTKSNRQKFLLASITPVMNVSACFPVLIILVGLAIPYEMVGGFIQLQGLTLFLLYILALLSGFIFGFIMKSLFKTGEHSLRSIYFPGFKKPSIQNLTKLTFENLSIIGKGFRYALPFACIIWLLSHFGAKENDSEIIRTPSIEQYTFSQIINPQWQANYNYSYAGMMEHAVAKVMKPAGINGEMGFLGLISLVRKEVLAGNATVLNKVKQPENLVTPPTGPANLNNENNDKGIFSFVLLFAFTFQCFYSIPKVYRETQHWSWPLFSLLITIPIAYLAAGLVAWI